MGRNQHLHVSLSHRYIMYIRTKGEIFLVDRDNSVFSCPVLTFPSTAEGKHMSDTLLDGVCSILCFTLCKVTPFWDRN